MSEAKITGTTDPEDNGGGTPVAAPAEAPTKAETQPEPAKETPPSAPAVVELTNPVDEPTVKEPAWLQRRINKATAEREAALRRVQELEILLAAHPAPATAEGEGAEGKSSPAKSPSPAEIEQQIAQRAAQLQFNRECERVFAEGSKQFPTFPKAIQDLNDKASMDNFTIETVMDFDRPAEVFMALAQDLDESSRIFALTNPRKKVQELTKFALSLELPKAKAKITKAPEPIETKIGGPTKTEVNLDSETVSTREWIAERERQVKERRKAGDKRIR